MRLIEKYTEYTSVRQVEISIQLKYLDNPFDNLFIVQTF